MERYSEYKDSGVKWLGEIPSHWELLKSKYLWKETFENSTSGKEDLLSVSQYTGVTKSKADSRSESLIGYKIVHKDDLVINIMLAWLGGLGVSNDEGVVSPAYCTYKLIRDYNPKFLHYLYKTPMYLAEFARHSTGVVPSRWRMYTDDFGQVVSLLPPMEEQDAIVRYLDASTSKIDKAIAMQQKMIDLLNERKQIIIQNAVTKGLDENVEMKDSGVEWIGMIPKQWEVRKIKSVTLFNPLPQKKFQPDDIIGYLPMDRLGFGKMKPSEIKYGKMPVGLNYFEDGDIVMAKVTPCFENGKIAIADKLKNGCAYGTSEIFVYRPLSSVSSKFILYSLQNEKLKSVFASTMMGTGGLKRINAIIAKNAQIALPASINEQKNIVSFLDEKISMFDSAISNCQRQITLLQERKQIIINEVVTGKVKVS